MKEVRDIYKKLTLRVVVALMAGLIFAPTAAAGLKIDFPTLQEGNSNMAHLYLYQKDPFNWSTVPGGGWGKMTYNLSGPTFESALIQFYYTP